jgi:hypothetical protein
MDEPLEFIKTDGLRWDAEQFAVSPIRYADFRKLPPSFRQFIPLMLYQETGRRENDLPAGRAVAGEWRNRGEG